MTIKYLTFKIMGIPEVDLIMHNGQLADPLNPWAKAMKRVTKKRSKTDADHDEIARLEFLGGLYLQDGKPCIPAKVLKATLVSAAKRVKKGKLAKSGMFVAKNAPLDYDGPTDAAGLWANERFRSREPKRVGTSTVMRSRPKFDAWSSVVTIGHDDAQLDATEVDEIVNIAGAIIGLMDDRPECGRFTAEAVAS